MTEVVQKKSKLPLVLAGVAALVLGAGGAFFAVSSGAFGPAVLAGGGGDDAPTGPDAWDQPSFVALDPMTISLGPDARARHLRVAIQLEVDPDQIDGVEGVTPRIFDVLNIFLRAVDERDIELPRAMVRLRAQMLRRVQLVAPPGAVRDVLIQEFILN